MKMRNLLPAALAVALTLVAGFYSLHGSAAPGEVAPGMARIVDDGPVK